MKQRDTSENAQRVLVQIYRDMPVSTKTMRIFEAYQTGKMLTMAGLRESHPDATDKQIWRLWAKRHLGEKLFNEVYGDSGDE
ncbi:MAG: hypothetical protein ACYS1A_03835 [Planctomycetota bacterium]|jgi:hypothetical protein